MEEDSFECISIDMPDEKRGISYVIITIDAVDNVLERNEYGDWECDPQHLDEMKEKFFEVNRKISHIQGGNDTP
jgi:hypothetical protein